jgi:iron complex outermembrane recepter protein
VGISSVRASILVGCFLATILIIWPAPPARAAPATDLVEFNIPAGNLTAALDRFAEQSGLQVVYDQPVTKSAQAKALTGHLSRRVALDQLLKGSGLVWSYVNDSTVVVRAQKANAADASKPTAADSEGPVSADVSVQSQRVTQKYDPTVNVDIPRTINDVQPYYIFDSETIEDSGASNVEDFLKQRLTMNTEVQSNNQLYGPTGYGPHGGNPLGNTSSIDLRGLGTNETLVLVDGHRVAGVNIQGTSEQPDVNGIPLAAIDRIEILPSSASAIYGGSAVGGVVNIILKKNYNGGDLRYSYENVSRGSAPIDTVDGTYGFSAEGGKTHVMISAHYSDAQPLLLQDRQGLVEQGINTILQNQPSVLLNPYGPFQGGNLPNIASASYDANGNPIPLTLRNGDPLNSTFASICPGISASSLTLTLNKCLLANAGKYNFALSPGVGSYGLQQPLGYSQRVESALLTARRDMTPWLEAFVEISVERNDGSSVYNPISDNAYYVSSSSPVNPFQQNVVLTIPSQLSAPLIANSTNRGMTLGLTAHLPKNWTIEGDYTWSQNRFENLFSVVDNDALIGDPNVIPPVAGVIGSGLLNPFVDTAAYPLKLRPYLVPQTYGSSSSLNDVALRGTGSIFQLPWGSQTLTIALEHRTEGFPTSTESQTYAISTYNDNSNIYFGQSQSTDSVYAETTVPLITNTNSIPGIRLLEVQLADRVERYTVDAGTSSEYELPGAAAYGFPGPTHTYFPSLDAAGQDPVPRSTSEYTSNNTTFGARYKPIDSITVRASIGTAFLPPTYTQLLPNPQVNPGGDFITDPKTGAMYSVNVIGGGNSGLQPEHDKNKDIGIIFQPADGALAALRLNLEYYNIVQYDAIVQLNGNEILSDPAFASRVTRSSLTGQITQINESLVNATEYQTNGWDLSADYRLSTPVGTFELVGASTLIEHERRQYSVNAPSYDYVGLVDAGGEVKTKSNGTLIWRNQNWKLGWTTTWFDSYQAGNSQAQGSSRVPSQIYHDLIASYSFGQRSGSILSNMMIQFGIKNIFNAAPPFDENFAPFYVSPIGSLLMRDFRLTIRKSF